MNFVVVLHLHCIDAVNARNERILVLFQVLMELWQDFLQQIELILRHCLDYEAPIVAEEEETAAGSGCLTRFEDLVPI